MTAPLVFLALAAVSADPLTVSTDFPGGSAQVDTVDQPQRLIRLSPTPHKDRGWACWWYFKVEGVTPGETISVNVGEAPWATPDRAMFSIDGRTWQHTHTGQREGKRITYRQRIDADEAWFAWGPPFVPADAERLVDEAAARSPHAEAFVLCHTRENRVTPALRIAEGDRPAEQRFGIWIQARQHAWESGSSWVAAGLVDWLVSDAPEAAALRQKAAITVVPIMDIDNVHRGAGGKNQVPQDHNRDWTDEPHWRAVAAAQQEILRMDADGRFDLFIDLHNPGANDREPYFYIPPDELLSDARRRNLERFLSAARAEMTGPLAFKGRTIVSGAKYDPKWQAISKNWVAGRCRDHVVSVTLETAWNTPRSTAAGYEQLGRELGRAIERYLREDVRPDGQSGATR